MTYYGVWKGHQTGIFTNWAECSKQIKGFSGAKYKKLNAKTKQEAEAEYKKGYSSTAKSSTKSNKNNKSKQHKVHNYHLQKGIHVFVDGSCLKNPGASSSGAAVFMDGILRKCYYGRYIENGSNNISELEAVLFYLKKIKDINLPVTLYVDSEYTINCFTKWGFNWERNNWKTSDGKPVKNKELVKECVAAYKLIKNLVTVVKVKSHIGEPGNELADYLAKQGSKRKVKEWAEHENNAIIQKLVRTGSYE